MINAKLSIAWRTHWDLERPRIVGPRLWSQTQPQRVRVFQSAAAGA